MCMIDYAEGRVEMLDDRMRTARKAHRCAECGRGIEAGERYMDERYVWEGELHQHRTCQHCLVVREWLRSECGGYCYGGVYEDIHEHVCDGLYGFGVKLLSIGISRRWTRRDGRMWPVPRMPKTTHEARA